MPRAVRRIVGLYVVIGSLAAGVSELGWAWLSGKPAEWAWAGAIKGWIFIAITAIFLFVLMRRMTASQQQSFAIETAALQARDRASGLLQALSDSSPDAIYAKDRQGRYLLINREAARATGTTPEQLVGRDDNTRFSSEQARKLRANDQQVMDLDRVETFEEQIDTADGRRTYLATKGPLHDTQGRVIGMFGISHDVTERIADRTRLRDSERHYRLLFDSNPHPLHVIDLESLRFLAVNEAMLAMYGYSREELLTTLTLRDLLVTEELGRLNEVHAAIINEERTGLRKQGVWVMRCKDGRRIEVESTSNDITFEGRSARLVLDVDVTTGRELERGREAARREAIAAHQLLNSVLARVDDGFVALDRDWRYAYLNDKAAQMLGSAGAQDLIGRHIWTEFPGGVGQSFQRAYEKAMASQTPVVFEQHYAPWDRWFENRVYPSPEGLSIYFTDITLRKQAEEGLRLSEQRYRLAAASGQVWDWDLTHRQSLVGFTGKFWQQLGHDSPRPEETMERFAALMHPDDVPYWRHAVREHLIHHAPYDIEFRSRHANGEWRWFHTQGQAVWNEDGHATYMAGTTFDITERKRTEESLRESEAYRRSVFEQLSEGVMLFDNELRIVDANPFALSMLGYPREDLLGQSAYVLVSDAEIERVQPSAELIRSGEPHHAEWEFVRHDGRRFPCEITARKLDRDHILAVVRDISERREAERTQLNYQLELSELTQQLLTQEKLMTRRVAQALHDRLGQTLAVARLNVDALLARESGSAGSALRGPLGKVEALLGQAIGEVRQVLTELRPPLLENQGLVAALDNEISTRATAAGKADVLLEVDETCAEQRWPNDVEYGAFMVAREAIANARQHADASLIRVVLEGGPGSLVLDIVDDGKGIPGAMAQGRPGHLGIVGMRERAIAIGAHFAVSQLPSGGTEVRLRWEARRT